MSNKLVAVALFACTFLCVTRNVFCEETSQPEVEVQKPGELYIINPGSMFPYIVKDPNNPILTDRSLAIRICNHNDCWNICRQRFGYNKGYCNSDAVCVCYN